MIWRNFFTVRVNFAFFHRVLCEHLDNELWNEPKCICITSFKIELHSLKREFQLSFVCRHLGSMCNAKIVFHFEACLFHTVLFRISVWEDIKSRPNLYNAFQIYTRRKVESLQIKKVPQLKCNRIVQKGVVPCKNPTLCSFVNCVRRNKKEEREGKKIINI